MATLRDIKRRIKAVQSTRQITKAMKMVSAAKLRRSQTSMMALRPHAKKMAEVISGLAEGANLEAHPLLKPRPRQRVEILVVTSDKGLCGAFNTNILKAARDHIGRFKEQNLEVIVSAVGKKALDFYKRRNVELRKTWTGISGKVDYIAIEDVVANLKDSYLSENADEVYILYNQFKNVVSQEITLTRLLPLAPIEMLESGGGGIDLKIYEPSEAELFESLLPKHVEIQVYRALLESTAAEEAARMSAMENATRSANDMIGTLTLQYNKARQASITAELMDIVGGVEALK